jgi:predicted enzyme related to lactoylglutathione lyase
MSGCRLVTNLAGVILWTSADRHPAMEAFYRDLLELPARSTRPGFINFDLKAARLTIAVHSEVAGPARDALRIMVNLEVDGLDQLIERLQAAGVEVIRPPEPEHWGGRIATLADPDGNIIQLLELPVDL